MDPRAVCLSNQRSSTPLNQTKVRIFIRHTCYETYESTLQKYPNTLLGNTSLRQQFYDYQRNAYYFDCKTEIFDAILFFYQTGILAKPCFSSQEEYAEYLMFFRITRPKRLPPEPVDLRSKIWVFMEQPHYNRYSLIYAYFAFCVILASVSTVCIESEIAGRIPILHRVRSIWFALECIFVLFFTFEYLVRVISTPKKFAFVRSVLGIIDLLAVVPFYLAMFLFIFEMAAETQPTAILRALRLVQIFRIMKLSRYSTGIKTLVKALACCKEQIGSLGLFFLIAVVFSASVVYLMEEMAGNEAFTDIPSTMWFSVISMTTVGYGDLVPKSPLGKLAATISIFMGTVILFHLFLPIYLMYFSIFYVDAQKQREEERLLKLQRNVQNKRLKDELALVQINQRERFLLQQLRASTAVAVLAASENDPVEFQIPHFETPSFLSVPSTDIRRGSTGSIQRMRVLDELRRYSCDKMLFPEGDSGEKIKVNVTELLSPTSEDWEKK